MDELVHDKNKHLLQAVKEEKEQLNQKDAVAYEAVNKLKWRLLEEVYALQKKETFSSIAYKSFFNNNKHWLVPYAAFCYFRDLYGTSDFNQWPSNQKYNRDDVIALFKNKITSSTVLLHCFVQFHLHVQLQNVLYTVDIRKHMYFIFNFSKRILFESKRSEKSLQLRCECVVEQ